MTRFRGKKSRLDGVSPYRRETSDRMVTRFLCALCALLWLLQLRFSKRIHGLDSATADKVNDASCKPAAEAFRRIAPLLAKALIMAKHSP